MMKFKNKYLVYKKSRCEACNHNGSFYPLDIDHVMTRGAHPDLVNNPNNCMTLCRICHQIKGQKGLNYMADTYPSVKEWLISHNWYFEEFLQKWRLHKEITNQINSLE